MKKIKSIEVKNSPFYADFRLEFSDKLNCIMGGRGTGKTTLLYFLKAALDKSSMDDSGASKLLRNNLGGGTITVEIESPDATVYNITKTIDDTPQPYILPSLDYIPLSKIFSEIDIVYSLYAPTITAIAQPVEEIAGNAITSILAKLSKKHTPKKDFHTITLKNELIIRGSTRRITIRGL